MRGQGAVECPSLIKIPIFTGPRNLVCLLRFIVSPALTHLMYYDSKSPQLTHFFLPFIFYSSIPQSLIPAGAHDDLDLPSISVLRYPLCIGKNIVFPHSFLFACTTMRAV